MAENWITLTDAEVMEEFTPAEKAMLKAIQGAGDKLPGILSRVVDQIREAYLTGGRPLGDAGMIPQGMRDRAVALTRWKWLTAFPTLAKMQTKDRKDSATEAEGYLLLIAKRELKGAGSAQIVSQVTRQMTRDKLSGL